MHLILIPFIALCIFMCLYIALRFCSIIRYFGKNSKNIWIRIISVILALFVCALCLNLWSANAVIIIHFIAVSIIFDIIFHFISKHINKANKIWHFFNTAYQLELLSLASVIIIVIIGFNNMQNIIETDYSITTDKNTADYKIAFLSDIHYDTIQDTSLIEDTLLEIERQDPDMIILGGDIVEEGTSKKSMEEFFRIMGTIDSTYGTYYVYGNHDTQPYTQNKNYSADELRKAITDNGITILEDSFTEINDDLIIAGRADAAWGNTSSRKSSESILNGVDRNKFIIMIDHQPVCAEENNDQGVDLQLSGHTHAGQIWPVGLFSKLTGVLNYGRYSIGNCTVITSSGVAGWGYPIRTEGHCEYCMITISQEDAGK